MKLNLLPSHVSKGKSVQGAIIAALVIFVASLVATGAMIAISNSKLTKATQLASDWETPAKNAVDTSAKADVIIAKATPLIINSNLAMEMQKHNAVYPAFYNRILPYIPSFYRISSLSATPMSADSVTVSMAGVLKTHQQYADLMLALNRIPGVQTVTRSGYQVAYQIVPALSEQDQKGIAVKPGETALPDNPLDRLEALIARGGTTGYVGSGGFGSGQPGFRGAMPDWSTVRVTVVLPGNLQTPNPRQTLMTVGSSASASVPSTTSSPSTSAFGPIPGPPTGSGSMGGGSTSTAN